MQLTHRKTRAALASVALLAVASAGARADQPVLIEREGASRLEMDTEIQPPEDAPPEPKLEEKAPEPEEEGPTLTTLAPYFRVTSIPDFILDKWFADHPSFGAGVSAGLAVDIGQPRDSVIGFELDWTDLVFGDANWLNADVANEPYSANWASVKLHMVSFDVSYRKYLMATRNFGFFFGGGLGLGGLIGKVDSIEVLPNCTEPLYECGHWRDVGRDEGALPTRVVPVVHVMAGAEVWFGESGLARLQLGIRNLPYVGISAGFRL